MADARAEALGEALFRSDEQAGSLTEANNQIAKLQERMVALESGDINQRLPVIKQMLGVDRVREISMRQSPYLQIWKQRLFCQEE